MLRDDRLITRVNIETDRLLEPVPSDWNRVVMRVTVWARRLIYGNPDRGS